jgi:hypothetical protein
MRPEVRDRLLEGFFSVERVHRYYALNPVLTGPGDEVYAIASRRVTYIAALALTTTLIKI